ncbi:MAG: hypothetical protein ABL897_11995, partial [Hyphomicrobium sp.]
PGEGADRLGLRARTRRCLVPGARGQVGVTGRYASARSSCGSRQPHFLAPSTADTSAHRLSLRRVKLIVAPLYALALAFAIAAALGNASGGRQHVAAVQEADATSAAGATEAYAGANAALAKLPHTRPVAVIETELAAILKDTRLNGCTGWLESAKLRTI